MSIEKIIKCELPIGEDFNYHVLYNNMIGAVHQSTNEPLLHYCIKEKIIELKKYLIEEKVSYGTRCEFARKKGINQEILRVKLRAYHRERDYIIAPFIYVLEMIEPKYELNKKINEEPILKFPSNIIVGHEFKKPYSFVRLYFKDSKIAINSSNDNIDNLINVLQRDDLTVYVLDTEENQQHAGEDIVIYKLIKKDSFNILKDKVEHEFQEKMGRILENLYN